MISEKLQVRETGVHVIGKCRGCHVDHDGSLLIVRTERVDGFLLCVIVDGTFHVLERLDWPEKVQQ